MWTEGYALGSRGVTLTPVRAAAPRPTLFESATRRQPSIGWQARLSVRLIGPLRIEAGAAGAQAELRTSIRNDGEGAPDQTLSGRFREQYYEGSLRADLAGLSLGSGRLVPGLFAGAGYLRQADRDATSYHAGLGFRLALLRRPTGALRAAGVRLDGRAQWRQRGLDFEGATRRGWAANAALFLGR